METVDKTQKESYLIGALLLTGGACCFALASAFSRKALLHFSPIEIFSIQHIIAFVVMLPWFGKKVFSLFVTKHYFLHLFRGVTGMGYFSLIYVAIAKMNVVDATLLANSTPIIVPFIARIWLGEKVSRRVWVGIFVAFFGVLFLIRPGEGLLQAAGLIAILAAICSASAIVSIRVLAKTESTQQIIFYYFFHGAVVGSSFLLYNGMDLSHLERFYPLLVMGVALAIAQSLIALSYQKISPAKIAPFNYFGALFITLFNWILFSQIPDLFTLYGMAAIVIGGLIAISSGRQRQKSAAL